MPDYAFEGPKWSSSVITWSFASAGGDITGAISGAYQSTVRAAIARWSQVVNLTFKEVADSAATDIRIGWGQFSGSQVGETDYSYQPTGGTQVFAPGVTVRLEDPSALAIGTGIGDVYQGTSTTLYQTALHEFGHALGLAHSTDQTAVMYPSLGKSDNGLGASDIQGIQTIYGASQAVAGATAAAPAPVQVPAAISMAGNSIAVYRFFDATNGTQFLTANLAERNTVIATRSDLTYEGLGMGALSSAGGDANAVPVYRFFDTSNGSHFFTTSASENAQILATRPDLVAEQPSFYEHATQAAGDIPVYRFFDNATGTHFFTDSSAEKAQLVATRADMTLEGVAFYAPSGSSNDAMAQAATAQTNPAMVSISDDTVLVYRFDSADGRQFLTADRSEGNTALITSPSLTYTGVAMGAVSPDAGDPAAAPVFRFFNAATGDHFLTASTTEAAQLAATRPDLVQEQTAFSEHLTQAQGDVPVYRFFDTSTGTHVYTASAAEHASLVATRPDMTQEGIAFYAPSISTT